MTERDVVWIVVRMFTTIYIAKMIVCFIADMIIEAIKNKRKRKEENDERQDRKSVV